MIGPIRDDSQPAGQLVELRTEEGVLVVDTTGDPRVNLWADERCFAFNKVGYVYARNAGAGFLFNVISKACE